MHDYNYGSVVTIPVYLDSIDSLDKYVIIFFKFNIQSINLLRLSKYINYNINMYES